MIPEISFGEKIRTLREKADLSLRELAKAIDISPPFLSDVELGRRFPSEETLQLLARHLNVPVDELKNFDTRESMNDLNRLVQIHPSLGFAFRTLVDNVKQGAITPDGAAAKIRSILEK